MIRARGLRREFGRLLAVDGISLDVPEGTLLALLGPNGAGKTTTVRMLAGLLAPSAGEASVDGCDVRTEAALVRARVGLVADSPGLHDRMTPATYLDFFGRVYGLEAERRRQRIDELLDLFELQDFRASRMAGFSRGMQQKVALARALLHEPSVVFLDEPTAGLDPLSARLVRELIVGLKQASRSIVLCTHDLDEAERLADTVAILRHGRIVVCDTVSALRANASSETLVQVTLAAHCPDAAALAARVVGVGDTSCGRHPTDAEAWVLTYTTACPRQTNPAVVSTLAAAGAAIISLTCSTATLEDVYTAAVARAAVAAQRGEWSSPPVTTSRTSVRIPGDLAMMWLIGWRAAAEALRDRMSLLVGLGVAVGLPLGLLLLVTQPAGSGLGTPRGGGSLGATLTLDLLVVGLLPTITAVGIAAGQFAGEKERGILTPLLASPASNLAIFGGKVLGAALPPMVYSTLAEVVYLLGIVVLLGVPGLQLLPLPMSVAVIVLVPAVTCFAVAVASLISSRVQTYNAAQQLGGLVLMPLWGVVFALAANLPGWGIVGLFGVVGGLIVLDVVLTVAAAATWRREEVLSQ